MCGVTFTPFEMLLLLTEALQVDIRFCFFYFFQLIKRCGILVLAQSDASYKAGLRVFLGVFKNSFLLSTGNRSPQ